MLVCSKTHSYVCLPESMSSVPRPAKQRSAWQWKWTLIFWLHEVATLHVMSDFMKEECSVSHFIVRWIAWNTNWNRLEPRWFSSTECHSCYTSLYQLGSLASLLGGRKKRSCHNVTLGLITTWAVRLCTVFSTKLLLVGWWAPPDLSTEAY